MCFCCCCCCCMCCCIQGSCRTATACSCFQGYSCRTVTAGSCDIQRHKAAMPADSVDSKQQYWQAVCWQQQRMCSCARAAHSCHSCAHAACMPCPGYSRVWTTIACAHCQILHTAVAANACSCQLLQQPHQQHACFSHSWEAARTCLCLSALVLCRVGVHLHRSQVSDEDQRQHWQQRSVKQHRGGALAQRAFFVCVCVCGGGGARHGHRGLW